MLASLFGPIILDRAAATDSAEIQSELPELTPENRMGILVEGLDLAYEVWITTMKDWVMKQEILIKAILDLKKVRETFYSNNNGIVFYEDTGLELNISYDDLETLRKERKERVWDVIHAALEKFKEVRQTLILQPQTAEVFPEHMFPEHMKGMLDLLTAFILVDQRKQKETFETASLVLNRTFPEKSG